MSGHNEKFEGTSISPAHLGDALAIALTEATLRKSENYVAQTVGADTGNAVAITLQVTDALGAAVLGVKRIKLQLFEATMIPSIAAAWTMAMGAEGTIVSTTANATIVFDTNALGYADVDIADVVTGTAATLYSEATLLDAAGRRSLGTVTFTT
jgi:hypothetical protein